MQDKKGVAIAFNTIIIAVIGLLVLAVIGFLLLDGSGNLRDGTECLKKQGRCVTGETATNCAESDRLTGEAGESLCPNAGEVCCSIVPRG